jgi:hypothetical protein
MRQKKSPGGMIRPGRETNEKQEMLYSNISILATGYCVSRREIRDFLRLLGGSRQEIALQAPETTVFPVVWPAVTDHSVDEITQVAGSLTNRTKLDGGDGPPDEGLAILGITTGPYVEPGRKAVLNTL